MTDATTMPELAGNTIKEVFNLAEKISDLHSCITSPRGDYFRLRMLQELEVPTDESAIEKNRLESGIQEYHRHLHKLIRLGLISESDSGGQTKFTRTGLGEKAVNAVRELQRSIGDEDARKIYEAALGPNSLRLFLRIYGNKPEEGQEHTEARYTPVEIGRLSLFLPRVIDGVSAVDRLSEARLVVYCDDGYIYVRSIRARGFYRYLRELHEIASANGRRTAHRYHSE